MRTHPTHRRFVRNVRGRDFVVGDIHGMFPALSRLLARVGFDEEGDRLFSVGDLIDRGPASRDALEWLAKPWFHAVRGNHEQFLLDSDDPETRDLWVQHNGGGWWLECGPAERAAFGEACAALPFSIEVDTSHGRVGVVHADVPRWLSWTEFVANLAAHDAFTIECALWSRERISAGPSGRVEGIDQVICGHTPITRVIEVDNVHFIDTGAVSTRSPGARLTMMEIEPGRRTAVSVKTGG